LPAAAAATGSFIGVRMVVGFRRDSAVISRFAACQCHAPVESAFCLAPFGRECCALIESNTLVAVKSLCQHTNLHKMLANKFKSQQTLRLILSLSVGRGESESSKSGLTWLLHFHSRTTSSAVAVDSEKFERNTNSLLPAAGTCRLSEELEKFNF
jgi:hypothetical protein